MNTYRKTAILTGVLYITGTVAGSLSFILTSSILEGPYDLRTIAANENQLVFGSLLVLLMALALAMVSVVLFPVMKIYNETFALGYVLFRGALETFSYIALVVCWLLLVSTSLFYVQAGAFEAATFHSFGMSLNAAEEIISSSITEIIFPLGALMLYLVLYQTNLIPRWISGWGLVAAILYLAAGLSNTLTLIEPMGTTHTVLILPMAIQEIVMAVWLIAKGFNPRTPGFENNEVDLEVQLSASS